MDLSSGLDQSRAAYSSNSSVMLCLPVQCCKAAGLHPFPDRTAAPPLQALELAVHLDTSRSVCSQPAYPLRSKFYPINRAVADTIHVAIQSRCIEIALTQFSPFRLNIHHVTQELKALAQFLPPVTTPPPRTHTPCSACLVLHFSCLWIMRRFRAVMTRVASGVFGGICFVSFCKDLSRCCLPAASPCFGS